MKERKIRIIILLMTLAALGLIAVQLYWITNAFKVEGQKFRNEVNDVLSVTVKKLEKQETASVVIDKFVNDKRLVVIKSDTTTIITSKINQRFSSPKKRNNSKGYSYNYKVNSIGDGDSIITEVNNFSWNNSDSLIEKTKLFTLRERIDSVLIKKKDNVNQIFYQLLAVEPNKPIMKRINPDELKNILSEELGNKGIAAEFNWGIQIADSDTILFTDSGYKTSLLKSEFKIRLFPDDLLGTPNYLLLYFPSQNSFVLRNLIVMFSLSAALIILIIFLFYKTISLLLTQKKISEIKNDLVNNITHEFKTPISTISLASESLAEPGILENKESVKKYSKIIADENNRLRSMVENLLNTAVLEKGNYHLHKQQINIHNIILELTGKYAVLVEKNEGRIKTDLQADNFLINADEFHLTGVLNNLIDNAVKFSQTKPEVLISTENFNNKIKISVSDNGIGIEKKNIDKIFETFYRVPAGNIHNVKGYGIGLSYAKKMVEAHAGEIFVHSKPDNGTSFEIILPVIK